MKYKLSVTLILFFLMVGCASANTAVPAAGSYTISSPGVYDLTGNITAAGTGLTNNADNVTVYGHGYTVFYENSSWGCGFMGIGAHSNVSMYDINFVCVNGSYNDGSAIYCTDINNMSIINCTGSTSAGNGITISNSQNSIILNSTGITNSSSGVGIYAINITNLTISNSAGLFDDPKFTGSGIFVYNTTYLKMKDCSGSTTVGYGAYLEHNSYANISNLSGISQNESGLSFLNCNYCNIVNSTGYSYNLKGIRLMSSTYSNMTDCNGSSILDNGLYLSNATNNTISRCSFSSSTVAGILFSDNTLNNTFSSMTVSSPYGSTPHSSKHIMAMGDSITYLGYGTYTNNTLNSIDPTWYFSNRGVHGENSSHASLTFLEELEIYNPGYVFIMYGTNDVYQNADQAKIISNILWMAATAREHNATPYILLVTPSAGDNSAKLALNANLSNAATVAGYSVINTWDSIDSVPLNGVNDSYNSSNYIDSDHPNDIGNQLLGAYIANKFMQTPEFNSLNISGVAPLTVQFLDKSPYATSWSWDFENDGKIDSTQQSPVHIYGQAGNYSVNLTIHNKYGNFSTVKTNYITVSAQTTPSILDKFWGTLKYYSSELLA